MSKKQIMLGNQAIARGAYEAILCSQEAKHATVELEEITVLENGDFEYRVIAQNIAQA